MTEGQGRRVMNHGINADNTAYVIRDDSGIVAELPTGKRPIAHVQYDCRVMAHAHDLLGMAAQYLRSESTANRKMLRDVIAAATGFQDGLK